MLIERQLENDFIAELKSMSELSASQVVGSREVAAAGDTKSEEDTKATIVAVACGFRQNDAFSLSPITMSMSITVMTRTELDPTSEGHDTVIEAIADLLSRWHKDGNAMSEALTNEKFLAGELRMDGGTARTYDSMTQTWSETISFSIRGAEKFIPPTPPTPPEPPTPQLSNSYAVYADGRTSEWYVAGETFNSFNIDKNGLVSLRIQNGIQYVGVQALMNASQLSSVELPSTLIELKQNAFDTCNLLSVTIPEGTYALRKQCLQDNRDMKTVVIPSTVDTIESDSFYLCQSVTDVYCYPNPDYLEWDDDGDDDFKPSKQTLCHVKSQWLQKYQSNFGNVNVTFVGDLQ